VLVGHGAFVEVTVESLSSVKKRLGIALPPEEVRAEIDQAYRGLQQHARIKGFRPGRVPRPILERHYGEQVRSEVIGRLIEDSYARALAEHNLRAVTRPEISAEEIGPETGLRYSVTIEIKPEFEVAGWDGLEVERAVAPVSEDSVDRHLERLRESFAQMARVDRDGVERGDLVEIGYTGVVEGHALPGASAPSRIIEIGSQTFPPPFEEELVGRRRGESVHIAVPYPPHHHSADIAGKTVTFRVEVKEIGRKELPPLDDDFAKDHGECGSLAELRAKIRTALAEAAEREADERVRAAVVERMVERNPIEIPDGLIERRFETLAREVGIAPGGSTGKPELDAQLDEIRAELRRRARAFVHGALVLERLAAQQSITATEAEIDDRIAQVLRAAPRERERLAEIYRAPESRREIGERLAQEKALAWLVAHVTITPGTAPNSIAAAEKTS